MNAKELEALLKRNTKKKEKDSNVNYLSSGSHLLNLALTDHSDRGYKKGTQVLLVGGSRSGKTFAVCTALAEAAYSDAFANYDLYYDNGEDGATMLTVDFFGQEAIDRIKSPPAGNSATIEELYYNIDDVIKKKKPFLYVEDSMDSLSSTQEEKKFQEQKRAHRKIKEGKEGKAKGSYGDGKAKINSAGLRRVRDKIGKNGSILMIIAQSRDNLDPYGPDETRAGGRALTFYAHHEIWFKTIGSIKKRVLGKERDIGTKCRITVKKNREAGRLQTITLRILFDHGIDDVGSMVEWLIDEGHWKKDSSGKYNATELELKGSVEDLTKAIEDNKKIGRLKKIVSERWSKIKEKSRSGRKKKYG